MSPATNEILQTFIATSDRTQTILLIGFALFVVWRLVGFASTRSKGQQVVDADDRAVTRVLVTELGQTTAALVALAKEQNETQKAMVVSADLTRQTLENSQKYIASVADRNLNASTVQATTALTAVGNVQSGVTDVLDLLKELKVQFTSIEKKLDTLFPQHTEWQTEFADLRTSLDNMARKCQEAGKKATDETPTLILPPVDIQPEPPAADAGEAVA